MIQIYVPDPEGIMIVFAGIIIGAFLWCFIWLATEYDINRQIKEGKL